MQRCIIRAVSNAFMYQSEILSKDLSTDSTGRDWVEAQIKENFPLTEAVNAPLINQKGVPPLPTQDQFIRSAQAALTRAQLRHIMKAQYEGNEFSFQVKLVSPSKRTDLVRTLLDGQPKNMGTQNQPQQGILLNPELERHLASRRSQVISPTWFWEFAQGAQIIENSDRNSGRIPHGMRGTDRYTWATLAATGLKQCKPLDVHFDDEAKATQEYTAWRCTILDEERTFMQDGRPYIIGGGFGPVSRREFLKAYPADSKNSAMCFRHSVHGSMQAWYRSFFR